MLLRRRLVGAAPLGVIRYASTNVAGSRVVGTVQMWNDSKGFGFVKDDGSDGQAYFVHFKDLSVVASGYRALAKGQRVQLTPALKPDGKWRGEQVTDENGGPLPSGPKDSGSGAGLPSEELRNVTSTSNVDDVDQIDASATREQRFENAYRNTRPQQQYQQQRDTSNGGYTKSGPGTELDFFGEPKQPGTPIAPVAAQPAQPAMPGFSAEYTQGFFAGYYKGAEAAQKLMAQPQAQNPASQRRPRRVQRISRAWRF
jgi:CspA family cold shock protein